MRIVSDPVKKEFVQTDPQRIVLNRNTCPRKIVSRIWEVVNAILVNTAYALSVRSPNTFKLTIFCNRGHKVWCQPSVWRIHIDMLIEKFYYTSFARNPYISFSIFSKAYLVEILPCKIEGCRITFRVYPKHPFIFKEKPVKAVCIGKEIVYIISRYFSLRQN